jgi:uncharacterized membrane protein (DUF106 family)
MVTEIVGVILFIIIGIILGIYFLIYKTNLFNQNTKYSSYRNYLDNIKKTYEEEHNYKKTK